MCCHWLSSLNFDRQCFPNRFGMSRYADDLKKSLNTQESAVVFCQFQAFGSRKLIFVTSAATNLVRSVKLHLSSICFLAESLFGAPRASPLPPATKLLYLNCLCGMTKTSPRRNVLQDLAVNFGAMVVCGFLTYQAVVESTHTKCATASWWRSGIKILFGRRQRRTASTTD